MNTYTYKCTNCDFTQQISQDIEANCPKCACAMNKKMVNLEKDNGGSERK